MQVLTSRSLDFRKAESYKCFKRDSGTTTKNMWRKKKLLLYWRKREVSLEIVEFEVTLNGQVEFE